jgi:hypothetical protein
LVGDYDGSVAQARGAVQCRGSSFLIPEQLSPAVSGCENGWTNGGVFGSNHRMLKSKCFRFRADAKELEQELFP